MILLVSQILERNATEYAFPLEQAIPDVEQRRELVRAACAVLGLEFDSQRTYDTWSAWHLARYLAKVTAREADATRDAPNYRALPDGALLAELGTDPLRWATACIQHMHAMHKADESDLLGWFANAIEAGAIAARTSTSTGLGTIMVDAADNVVGVELPRKSYANQAMVESHLGKPDGALTDAAGNVVGGMWVTPRGRFREAIDAAFEKFTGDKIPHTREGYDTLESLVERELGEGAIVAVEVSDQVNERAEPLLKFTTMIGGKEIEIVR